MSLVGRFDKLSPREQRMLAILGAVFAIMLLVGVPYYVYDGVSTLRSDNALIREQLRNMDRGAELLAKRRHEREAREQLYGKRPPALASFIENAARAQGLEVPESTDQPDVQGKGFVERIMQVKLRKVGLKPLVLALEQMERAGLPIAITRLRITARTAPDEFDVTLAVSAYEKKQDDKPKAAAGKGGVEL